MTEYRWEGREELVRRAKKRVLGLLAIVAPLAVLAGVLSAVLAHHHPNPHRHTDTAGGIAVGLIVLVVYAAAALIAVRVARKRGRRFFAGRPIQGLPFRDQRRVGRAIRNGTPSSDPLLANVEREIADRLVRGNPKLVAIAVSVLGLVYVAGAVLTPVWWSRVIFACLALLSPALYVLYRRQVKRARRYLEVAGHTEA